MTIELKERSLSGKLRYWSVNNPAYCPPTLLKEAADVIDQTKEKLAAALQQCANGAARLEEAARLVPLLYVQLQNCSYLVCSRPATHGSDTPDAACDAHVEWLRGEYSSEVGEWPEAATIRAAAAWIEAALATDAPGSPVPPVADIAATIRGLNEAIDNLPDCPDCDGEGGTHGRLNCATCHGGGKALHNATKGAAPHTHDPNEPDCTVACGACGHSCNLHYHQCIHPDCECEDFEG
jgi:hypothetical protein